MPKFWRYVNVPEQQDAMKTLKEMQNTPSLNLAARKFCDETKANGDSEVESLEDLQQRLSDDSCHGRDFNHLLWDFQTMMDSWSKKSEKQTENFKMRFAFSDGGAILTEAEGSSTGHTEKKMPPLLTSDPYNSSLYKIAVLSKTPVVFIHKHADR